MTQIPTQNAALPEAVFFPMTNPIQNYAWGSKTAFQQLFELENPTDEPQAELWMGAHPNGCSGIAINGKIVQLSDFIAQNPNLILGEYTARQFGELPYLFKILAAENALSIQVHPNKQQAERGFAQEEKLGIAPTAAYRNYKDPNHKPELVYALTEYQAMNGFRANQEILNYFIELSIDEIQPLVDAFQSNPTEQGLKDFFSGLLSLQGEIKNRALEVLITQAKQIDLPLFQLIVELEKHYPNDIGLFAPLMLNVITLQPGEAMFLDAETPHAYLHGTGLEIMANSDNVLRAGLTPKYMDIDELVACTQFKHKPLEQLRLKSEVIEGCEQYPIPVADFKFAIIPPATQQTIGVQSAEIVLPLDSSMILRHTNGEKCLVRKGQSVFIPAYAEQYTIECDGRVARAFSA
ncbi:mannose-6-phosphate isomerase, class I [Vibrio cholerae]|uniref:mannose-6-phosphate isomerase, class I n=1 Tax=Vibrio cholerae TaxID=666 RepID=UPI000361C5B7|nr:mannose-6-phosphate isomerase, class I [Vibrio cholerae]EGQ7978741.1 mannose-6-phosphate isomerase, class I [Vibrio cholerae]EIC9799736.1 mannose-6-phosphate isomerase, class I [Vibrio cholerae]ELS9244076.1 mannose-6-phosphate isomerase, class I [Vibrio cholerae]MBJ6919304.1 mannose-6-phosphate isomerase, class I [Vibrio cholerae]GIB04141.1 mannose-6-phosphate isomerase [Vibrio cholerae]